MKNNKIDEKSFDQSSEKAKKLYRAFVALQTEEEARVFLQDLCSPAELQSMIDRWLVVSQLKEGKSYREIYDDTGVSVTTVGRVARCMSMGTGAYNLIYQRVGKKDNE
jgi:TrpR-related protein YerC/YecD